MGMGRNSEYQKQIRLLQEIEKLKRDVNDLKTRENYRIFEGTTFPTGMVVGDYFYRNDPTLDILFRKTETVSDGDRWLSVPEYPIGYEEYDTTIDPDTIYFGTTRFRSVDSLGIFYTAYSIVSQVDAPNNAANYWTIEFLSFSPTLALSSSIYSFDTDGDGVGVTSRRGFPFLNQITAQSGVVGLTMTKTGAPGQLTVIPTIFYKILGDP